jgi:hypothetical protein
MCDKERCGGAIDCACAVELRQSRINPLVDRLVYFEEEYMPVEEAKGLYYNLHHEVIEVK